MSAMRPSSSATDILILRFALGLTLGMLLIQQLPALPPAWASLPLALVVLLFLRLRQLFLLSIVIGLGWAWAYGTYRLADALPETEGRQEVLVEGWVKGIPSSMDRGLRFDLRVARVIEPTGITIPRLVRISWYDGVQPLKAGESWRLRLSLRPPRGMMNPGGFDYEQWLFAQGIRAVGYVRDTPENRPAESSSNMNAMLQSERQRIYDRLGTALGKSPVAGLLKALTMGEQDDITRAQWEVLRRTGTAHLIAISGSHVGLIAGFILVVTLKATARLGIMRWPPPAIAAWAGLLAALLYSALADFAIPTQRAMIMIAVAMGGIVCQRHLRASHVLALALVAVLLWDPLAVVVPGFWLSFGAVAMISYTVVGRLGNRRAGRLLWHINWITAIGLAPLLLLFFGQVSLISPVANLLAVPILGTILIPLCLTGTLLLAGIPTLGQGLLTLAEVIMQTSWRVLEALSVLPYAQWTHAEPPIWCILFALLGVIWLLAPRGIPGRWLGLVMWLPAALYEPDRPNPGGYQLTLLDVGQGLAAIIETRHKTLIYDTGARLSASFDMGSAVIEPYLHARGKQQIDALIVSHGDNDHIGGARSLLETFTVNRLFTSVASRFRDAPVVDCMAGQQWEWDEVVFEMMGPVVPGDKENDNSCVLKVSAKGGSVLLTGDIEAEGERQLLQRNAAKLKSEVLIVPHHGSKTSSSEAFVQGVSPRWALIPAGYLNRFGFPHSSVTARYQGHDVTIMNSGADGAISLKVDIDTGVSAPTGWRRQHRHYWTLP
jgi:competence protein ComEC